jgi:hypothetical protein
MRDANTTVQLPYGMDARGVVAAINDLYAYLHAINGASVQYGYDRLEDIQLRAAFSGLISEIMVRSLAFSMGNRVPGLARNLYPNGHPDLIPRAMYPGDAVQNGDEGVEVKAARNPTSIQAHNTGEGWYGSRRVPSSLPRRRTSEKNFAACATSAIHPRSSLTSRSPCETAFPKEMIQAPVRRCSPSPGDHPASTPTPMMPLFSMLACFAW